MVTKFNSTQLWGPSRKGMKVLMLLLVALAIPSANLSSLKSCASSPQIRASCWNARFEKTNSTLGGALTFPYLCTLTFPSLISLSALLTKESRGGCNLWDSYKIILVCMNKKEKQIPKLESLISTENMFPPLRQAIDWVFDFLTIFRLEKLSGFGVC